MPKNLVRFIFKFSTFFLCVVILLSIFFQGNKVKKVYANTIQNICNNKINIDPQTFKTDDNSISNITISLPLSTDADLSPYEGSFTFHYHEKDQSSFGIDGDVRATLVGTNQALNIAISKTPFVKATTYEFKAFINGQEIKTTSGGDCIGQLVVENGAAGSNAGCSFASTSSGNFTECDYISGTWSLTNFSCSGGSEVNVAQYCQGTDRNKFSSLGSSIQLCLPCVMQDKPILKHGDRCIDGDNCGKYSCRSSASQSGNRCLLSINSLKKSGDSCIPGEQECDQAYPLSCSSATNTCQDPPQCPVPFPNPPPQTDFADPSCSHKAGFSPRAFCNSGRVCQEPDITTTRPGTPPWELCNQIDKKDPAHDKCVNCSGNEKNPTGKIYTAIGCIQSDPKSIVQTVIQIGLSLAGGVALIMIIASGFIITISSGDQSQMKIAREMLSGAIIGLIFIIMSVTILQFIGLTILHIPGFGG